MADTLPTGPAPSETSVEIHPVQTVVRFLRAVRRRKGVMIVALAASSLLGGLYYATTPRLYESTASLLVLNTGADVWSTEMATTNLPQNLIKTYQKMLESETVVEDALAHLGPEDRADLVNVPREGWVKALQANLNVTTTRNTNTLDISYRSKEPQAAAAVVNALLTAYLAYMDTLHRSNARELLDVLTREEHDLKQQLRTKEAELLSMNAQALMIRDGESNINAIVKRAAALNDSLIAAHAIRLKAEAQAAAIERSIRNGEELQQHALAMAESVGQEALLQRLGLSTTDAQTVARVTQRILEDRALLESEQQLYGSAHQRVRRIQQRIQVMEEYLKNRMHAENTALHNLSNRELAPLLQQMALQRRDLAISYENAVFESYEKEKLAAIGLNKTMAQLDILALDLARLNGFYEVVLQRLKDINLGKESGLKTSVLMRPKIPAAPAWPKKDMVAMISIVLGLAAGLIVIYLQELLDDHFRSAEELRTQLGIPVLAIVQRLEPLAEVGIDGVHVHVRPNAVETEAFRTLRTALALVDGGVQRLVISSSEPGDGKTLVTVNLAVAFAQSGKKTLVIDADLRRPGLTPLLAMRGERGLSTMLRENTPIAESAEANLRFSGAENLDILPSGPRPINPTELLASDRFSELLAWAETKYEQILLDSPPALVSDTAIIGRLVDGVLLTVEPEKNRRQIVIRTVESFPLLGINVLGIVVNCKLAERKAGSYGYGYGYGYGEYGYGYAYGHEEDARDEDDADGDTPSPTTIVRRAA